MNFPFIWDYDLDEEQFCALFDGKHTIGRLDSDWAAVRLLEVACYPEIVRLLGLKRLIEGWPKGRKHIRSTSRLRSFDVLSAWLPAHSPDWGK